MTPKLTPEQFAYWLQGFCELGAGKLPNQDQWDSICEHLDLVFDKVTVKRPPAVAPTNISILLQEAIDSAKPAPAPKPGLWPSPLPSHYPGAGSSGLPGIPFNLTC